jgi:hypothetical protein
MVVPTLSDLLLLRQETPEHETLQGKVGRNHAFTFFIEHILKGVVGAKRWEDEISSRTLSDSKAQVSDVAFALVACENMWQKWYAEHLATIDDESSTEGAAATIR